jgi:hypothetical protein
VLGALAIMGLLLFLMGRGGKPPATHTIGSGDSRSGLVEVRGGEAATSNPPVIAQSTQRPRTPTPRLIAYFRELPVLSALDTDRDKAISDAEMSRAPTVLRLFDADHDGSLNSKECGFSPPAGETDRALVERSSAWFLRVHPLLAALDADSDGRISPLEIATATAALLALDWDHDGELTADELLPDPVVNALVVYMVRWDLDGDRRISPAEALSMPKQLREVMPVVPVGEKSVSEAALRNELRRRAISDGDGGARQLEMASTYEKNR